MVDSLTLKVNHLEEEAEDQRNTSDHLEQYSRRHSLRIVNNWPEQPNENTDLTVVEMVKQCLDIDITPDGIDRSHRVGPPTMNRTRPVITKLKSCKTKARIYKARNRLNFAGPGARQIHINEDLTKTRSTLFKRALKLKKENLVRDTWTTDGNILVRDCALKTHIFTRPSDFDKWEHNLREKTPELYSQVVQR